MRDLQIRRAVAGDVPAIVALLEVVGTMQVSFLPGLSEGLGEHLNITG